MSKTLVVFNKNWADEFDVDGFRVYDTEKFESLKKRIESNNFSLNYNFGTNQGWENQRVSGFFKSGFTYKEITEEEAATIKKLFGNFFGVCPSLDSLAHTGDDLDDDDYDYEEDDYYDDEDDWDEDEDEDDWL